MPAHNRLTYLENIERQTIAAFLASADGNKRQVARILGVSRATLYLKAIQQVDGVGDRS